MEVMKRHPVSIDMYKTSSDTFEVVEGDTANLIVITLTDRGKPVDLTACKVVVSFTRGGSPAEQDTDGHGVTISGEHHNIITVDLYASSFVNGNNTAEVQVWSGENYARLATSAWFNFKGRRARVNEDTLPAVPTFPLLSSMLEKLANIARGVQAKWSTTDTEDASFIQDKPVIGTDIQSPTNALTVDYTPAGTDELPGYRPTVGHRKFTLASILGYIRTQLDTYFAPILHKARHTTGGADALTPSDIGAAAATHASQHASDGADPIPPLTIGAAGLDADNKVLADQASAKIVLVTASETLSLNRSGKHLLVNGSVNMTITIPANATVAFPVGTEVELTDWIWGGRMTITPASGVTIYWTDGPMNAKTAPNVGATCVGKQVQANVWLFGGF